MPQTLTWPVVVILGFVLAGVSFLGYDHILSGQFVASIYAAIAGAVTAGHFATVNQSGSK